MFMTKKIGQPCYFHVFLILVNDDINTHQMVVKVTSKRETHEELGIFCGILSHFLS